MSAVICVMLVLLVVPFPGVAVFAAVVVAVLASDEELLLVDDEDDVPDELEVVLDEEDVSLELELLVVPEELEFCPLDEVAANPSCWSSNSVLSV